MPRPRSNPHEESARRRKAYDFGEYLHGQGVTEEGLSVMGSEQFAAHVKAAGLRSAPSAETMEQVRAHLRYKAYRKANPIDAEDILRNM